MTVQTYEYKISNDEEFQRIPMELNKFLMSVVIIQTGKNKITDQIYKIKYDGLKKCYGSLSIINDSPKLITDSAKTIKWKTKQTIMVVQTIDYPSK